MINKKSVLLVLACASLAACGSTGSGNGGNSGNPDDVDYNSATELDTSYTGSESLTYWTPTTDTTFMETQVAAFKKANTGFTGTITLKANMGEGDVKTELLKDPEAGADIMSIADDNIKEAVTGRALTSLGSSADKSNKDSLYYKLLAHQSADGVGACSVGGKLYGFPYRNDNGYTLMYDKRVVSDEQAKTLEGVLAACKTAGAVLDYDLGNSWYGASYLWANGCTTTTDAEGLFHATFNTQAGVDAVLAMNELYKTYGGSTFLFSGDTSKFGVEGTGRVGAVIEWNNYTDLSKAVGGASNIGVAVLPSFKINGADKQLKSFMGYKAFSIRKATAMTAEKLKLATAFCSFLTTKAIQKERLTTLKQGVSDRQLGADSTLWTDNPFMLALNKMAAAGNVVSQATGSCGNYWTPMTDFNNLIKAGTLTKDNCMTKLTEMVTAMEKTGA